MQYQGERKLIAELTQPGMRVLDVGTAATGRSALLLREAGCDVTSVEINSMALTEFVKHGDPADIHLAVADVCRLPFVNEHFDLVLVAFHGLDYLLTGEVRRRAYQEVGRILKKRGRFAFNAFNRLGVLFSPSNFLDKTSLKLHAQHVMNGDFLKPTLRDMYNLELHQALPQTIIRQVHEATDMRFQYVTNLSGTTRSLALITLFAAAPYYVFARK
jgi:ubiquinone/menaquinone biosynthesis C-methylase UbiE